MHTTDNFTPLEEFAIDEFVDCARFGELDDMKQMLLSQDLAGRACSMKDSQGNSALHMACANGHEDVVDWILSSWNLDTSSELKKPLPASHPINAKNRVGSTSLHWCMLTKQLTILEKLLHAGADSELRDDRDEDCIAVGERFGTEEGIVMVARWRQAVERMDRDVEEVDMDNLEETEHVVTVDDEGVMRLDGQVVSKDEVMDDGLER